MDLEQPLLLQLVQTFPEYYCVVTLGFEQPGSTSNSSSELRQHGQDDQSITSWVGLERELSVGNLEIRSASYES